MSSFLSGLNGKPLSLLESVLKSTLHIESSFRIVVSLAFEQSLEAVNGVAQLHQLSLSAGEDLTHEEGLGKELLDLSGSGHGQLVVF